MGWLLASLDSLESAKLIYWVYVGQMASVVSELVSSQQRFHPLPVGGSSPNFQDILVVWSSWCPSLFLVKKFLGSKVTAQKGVKRLKSISSYSFWARMFIFSGCVVLPSTKKSLGTDFRFRAPKFYKKFSKTVKILNFFIIWARTSKISC